LLEQFSYKTYKELLELLTRENRSVCFEDCPLPNNLTPYFILRHDVDFYPEAALRIAELEAGMRIRASYFLLFSSPFYNLLSESYCRFPKRLIELGHEVGLHYDLRAYGAMGGTNSVGTLFDECEILKKLTGRRVRSIAMHNPSLSGADPFRNLKELVNAYDDQYTTEIAYYSDSCGAWGNDAVAALRPGHVPAQLQLLIHPFFWDEASLHRLDRLNRFIEERIANLRTGAETLESMWANHPRLIEYENRRRKQG